MPYSRSGITTPAVPEQIQDEGIDLARRQTLNFVGAGVSVADTGGKTTITIPGGLPGDKNILDYGASTASADNSSFIQAAAAAATASGGRTIVPSGSFTTSPLTLPPQTVLQGMNGWSYLATPTNIISKLVLKAASSGPLIGPDDSGASSTGVKIFDLMLDTNNIAQSAIYLADAGGSIPRLWSIERCLFVNSGFSSGAHGSHVYIGNLNTACVMRDCQLLSNAAGTVTQNSHGWDGIGWYGSDGLIDNCFIGCYSDAGIYTYGGSNDMILTIRSGGTFWNSYGLLLGGTGVVIDSMSIDHIYNDGIYAAYPFTAINCDFSGCSLQTNNQWSHINVANPVVANIISCRQLIQPADGGANLAKYFITANAGAKLNQLGNYQESGATLGTGWTDYAGTYSAPAFPASTVAATNTAGADVQAFVANGTSAITSITLGATVTGMQIAANGWGSVRIPMGQSVKFTYAGGSPTWTWVIG